MKGSKKNLERDIRAMRLLFWLFGISFWAMAAQYLFSVECSETSSGAGIDEVCHYFGPKITGILAAAVGLLAVRLGSKERLRKKFESYYT